MSFVEAIYLLTQSSNCGARGTGADNIMMGEVFSLPECVTQCSGGRWGAKRDEQDGWA